MIRLSMAATEWGQGDFEKVLISDLQEHLAEFPFDCLDQGELRFDNSSVADIEWEDDDDSLVVCRSC